MMKLPRYVLGSVLNVGGVPNSGLESKVFGPTKDECILGQDVGTEHDARTFGTCSSHFSWPLVERIPCRRLHLHRRDN